MAELWVVVADSAQATFYARTGHKVLSVVGDMVENELQKIDKDARKPGRMREAAPISGHVYGHKTDLYEHDKREFARKISHKLKEAADQFEQLIVIASPLILGELRKHLDANIKQKVEREIDKDMTKVKPDEIAEFLFSLPE